MSFTSPLTPSTAPPPGRLCPRLHFTPHSIHCTPPGHLCPRSHLTPCSIHRAPQAIYAHACTLHPPRPSMPTLAPHPLLHPPRPPGRLCPHSHLTLTLSTNQRVKRLTFAGSRVRCMLACTPMHPWASTLLRMYRWDTHACMYTAPAPPSELQVCRTHTQCM